MIFTQSVRKVKISVFTHAIIRNYFPSGLSDFLDETFTTCKKPRVIELNSHSTDQTPMRRLYNIT